MFQIDTDTAVPARPAPTAAGAAGWFTGGTPGPGTPVPATEFSPDWCNMVQGEMGSILTAMGIAQDKTKIDQVLSAIKGLIQLGSGTYVADTGAANAYVITPAPAITAYAGGQTFKVQPSHANTGASTINVNGLGVKSIVHADGSALQAGDIPASGLIEVIYQAAIGKFVLNTFTPAPYNTSTAYFRIPGTPLIIQMTSYHIGIASSLNVPSPMHWGLASVSLPFAFANAHLHSWATPTVDTDGQCATVVADSNGLGTAQLYVCSSTSTAFASGTLFSIGY